MILFFGICFVFFRILLKDSGFCTIRTEKIKIKLTGPRIKLTSPRIKLTCPRIKLTRPKIK